MRHGLGRGLALGLVMATVVTLLGSVISAAEACTKPRPPKVWRVYVPGSFDPNDPQNSIPPMLWVGVPFGVFLSTGATPLCTCGLGFSSTLPAGISDAQAVVFTLNRKRHRPLVIGKGPLGDVIAAFDLERDRSIDPVLQEEGSLPNGQWFGFQSPQDSPVDLDAVQRQLAEAGALANTAAGPVLRSPYVIKIWFKFNLPFPADGPITVPPLQVQTASGVIGDPHHPVEFSDVTELQDVVVDPENPDVILANVTANVVAEQEADDPSATTTLELDSTLVQIPFTQELLDDRIVNRYELRPLFPPRPWHWWLKILRPVFRLTAVRACFDNPELPACRGVLPPGAGATSGFSPNGYSASDGNDIMLADHDDATGAPVPGTESAHATFNASVEAAGAGMNVVDVNVSGRVLSADGNDAIPQDGAESYFKLMTDNIPAANDLALKPYNRWRRVAWGRSWRWKILPGGVIKHVIGHWHMSLHWRLPILVDPELIPPNPFEGAILTNYQVPVAEGGPLLVEDEVRFNPIQLNPEVNACIADADRDGVTFIQDLARLSAGYRKTCRLVDNPSILPDDVNRSIPDFLQY